MQESSSSSTTSILIDALWNVNVHVLRQHVAATNSSSSVMDDDILESLIVHMKDCTTVLEDELHARKLRKRQKEIQQELENVCSTANLKSTLSSTTTQVEHNQNDVANNSNDTTIVSMCPIPTEVLRQITRIDDEVGRGGGARCFPGHL